MKLEAFSRARSRAWAVGQWLHILVLTLGLGFSGLSCSGKPVALGKSEADRRLQAQRLRGGAPRSMENATADPKATSTTSEETAQPLQLEVLPPSLEAQDMLSPAPSTESVELLVLGEYALKTDGEAILDGDTIKVDGLGSSLRLVGFDAEETFKKDKDRSAAAAGFDTYAKTKRGKNRFPVKFGTPMGEEATRWAKAFFAGHDIVRLEYDEASRQFDVYGRYLVHVFVKKSDEWVNYNVEAVRAGMAPYFPKYGYSRRFHDDFVQAQEQARAAGLGIWGDSIEHYPDYDERLNWWTRRANAIVRFEENYANHPDVYQLGHGGNAKWQELIDRTGQVVTVFGTAGRVSRDDSPFLIRMTHDKGKDFTVVAFTEQELEQLRIDDFEGEMFYVRGKLSTYNGRPQFRAENVERIWTE